MKFLMKHALSAVLALICVAPLQSQAAKLPALSGNAASVTVSGISAGGFMAIQLLMAHSSIYHGAGSVAGGPWHCAQGSVSKAQSTCMANTDDIDVRALVNETHAAVAAKGLDPLGPLQTARVYLYGSEADDVVRKPMLERLAQYMQAFVPATQIKSESSVHSAHGWPTIDYGGSCSLKGLPWIINCGFDLAGEMLTQFYGILQPRTRAVGASMKTFDQSEFDRSGDSRLANSGWVYIPQVCAAGNCKVHVALHGCQQSPEYVQDKFATHVGLNEWAESNGIIVLYPQAKISSGNPYACWDWFGYTGSDYATVHAPQIKSITAMVERLTAH